MLFNIQEPVKKSLHKLLPTKINPEVEKKSVPQKFAQFPIYVGSKKKKTNEPSRVTESLSTLIDLKKPINEPTRVTESSSTLIDLKKTINEPTRVTESSSTLIELSYTDYIDRVSCSGVSHIAISDLVCFSITQYLLINYLRETLPSLTEIFKNLITKVVETKPLNKTSLELR